MTNQSEYPVYIKSHFLDWNARTKRKAEIFQEMKMGSDLVHKIPGKGGTIRIFRLRECSILMRQQVQVSQGLDNGSSNVPNGGILKSRFQEIFNMYFFSREINFTNILIHLCTYYLFIFP